MSFTPVLGDESAVQFCLKTITVNLLRYRIKTQLILCYSE